jgi:RND family efflux transporter MFP subunit
MNSARSLLFPALAVAALLSLAGCSKSKTPRTAADEPNRIAVQAAPVAIAELPVLTEVTGTVRAVQRATVAAKVTGTIAQLPVTLGQRVAEGELLLEIAAPEIAARVAQARAQLSLTERELARDRALTERGVAPPEQVRALEDRLAIQTAQLREAETLLSYAQLRAPFAGIVTRRFVDAGDLASPGQPLLGLDGAEAFQIEVAVPDSLVTPLRLGQALAVTIPAGDREFSAPIAELSSAADPTTRAVLLKLTVPASAGVRPGQFARVLVPGPTARTLLVPSAALTRIGQMERVFVVGPEKRAVLRLVKTGAVRGEHTEILSGLDAGEQVVVAPPATLREGAVLEVRP